MDTTTTQNPHDSAPGESPEVTPQQQAALEAALKKEQAGVDAVAAAADGNEGIPLESEIDGLDYLLGAPVPVISDTKVKLRTPKGGVSTLVFVIKQIDGRDLDAIEAANTVNGRPDMITINAEICAKTVLAIISSNGNTIAPLRDPRWLEFTVLEKGEPVQRRLPSIALAFEKRFRTQQGLLSGVADQVRKVSGYAFDAVSDAKPRVLSGAEAEAWLSTASGN